MVFELHDPYVVDLYIFIFDFKGGATVFHLRRVCVQWARNKVLNLGVKQRVVVVCHHELKGFWGFLCAQRRVN